jgi:hypothetical protein
VSATLALMRAGAFFFFACIAGCFTATGVAFAQESTDPEPGSPPGRVYELPVDTGRKDAAPRGGDSGSNGPSSTFRSDNNFGTSSSVPGGPGGGAQGGSGGSGSGGSGGSGSGDGGDANVSGLEQTAFDTGDPSPGGGYALLIVVALGGLLLGVAAARVRVSNSRQT